MMIFFFFNLQTKILSSAFLVVKELRPTATIWFASLCHKQRQFSKKFAFLMMYFDRSV